jgi:pyrimidine deaminase RibD-like protein
MERSIRIAMQKRPIEPERIDQMISGIVRRLESMGETDIPSKVIGEIVMETLARIDTVAYVRLPAFTRTSRRRTISTNSCRNCAPGRFPKSERRPATWIMRCAGAPGLGNTWPNPAVGCVIVNRDGRVVGRGWTQPGGRPHAEVMALAQAGRACARRHRLCHAGALRPSRQDPALRRGAGAAGIARVVSALTDPDPRVAGRGHAILRAAGIEVTEGLRAPRRANCSAAF